MNLGMKMTLPWNSKNKTQKWAERIDMNSGLLALGSMGLGAGLMYLFDPNRGRRRRAMIRDQAVHANRVLNCAVGKTSRDVSHRAYGLWAKTSHLFRRDNISDDVLTARVRSCLGRAVSHPHAIQVTANDGRVVLSGDILAAEVGALLSCVSKVRGVQGVEDQLTVHAAAGDEPNLQGGRPRQNASFELMQTNWSPSARLLVGLAGGAMMGYCLKRRDALGVALGTVGFGLFARAVTNQEMKSLVGVGRDCQAIGVQKTININAPVGQVFDFWNDYRNFPRFMTNVREVRPEGNGRSHWIVAGPAGVPVEWTAEVTGFARNEMLSWRTVPGSRIKSEGSVHFQPANGGTRVHISLCYLPPGGVLGHALAKLFGSDPKSEMDADLVRMKTLIETGHAPRDAARPWSAEREVALTRTTAA